MTGSDARAPGRSRGFGWPHAFGFLFLTVVLTTIATVWAIKTFVFPSPFTPVDLSAKEQQVLSAKLEGLEAVAADSSLEPEPYTENDAQREVALSERELNGLIAGNPDLARRVVVDLSDGLVSAKVLIPIDEDFPMFGGQTLRVRAGVELAYENDQPVVAVKGVSVLGVPIPNAWLGGIKNIDLVEEFAAEEGFWKAFAAGVEDLQVRDGQLWIKLKE